MMMIKTNKQAKFQRVTWWQANMIATENAVWCVLRVKEEVQDLKQILRNPKLQPASLQCNTRLQNRQAGLSSSKSLF